MHRRLANGSNRPELPFESGPMNGREAPESGTRKRRSA
jgi:hypothetical protein